MMTKKEMNKITIEQTEDGDYQTECTGDFGKLLLMLTFAMSELLKKVKDKHTKEYMSQNIDEIANLIKHEVLDE